MNKKIYTHLMIQPIAVESEGSFLEGSVTSKKISVQTVTVEPYQDGFAEQGGYQDISFD